MEFSSIMGRRPLRIIRLPERYRDGIDVTNPCTSKPAASAILLTIEPDHSAFTNSSGAGPYHHSTPSPSTTTSSLPNDTPTTPTSSTRRGGAAWRKEVRATLKQVDQIVQNRRPVQAASPPHMQAARPLRRTDRHPVYTTEDEYDITSPGFGLKHTPEWEDMDIDIDDESQPRWFPGDGVSASTYEDLTDACKLMMVHELTKQMSFKSMVSWLQLSDTQLIDFVRIYEIQYQGNIEEERLTLIAMSHLSAIRKVREEQLPGGLEINNIESPTVIPPEDFPPFQVIQEVTEAMSRYTKLGVECEWDLDHDIGLRQYIEHETELAAGVNGIVISDDEEVEKAEEPARRIISRPKKKGRQFANKPVGKRADLLKLKLPSKLQQMESVDCEDEVES
ncbi:predicted protein [Sclerotinia sclerotiorum 1980 UF-70]|uniref:Uncharacterized protein n=1 Tax=Sclerotinia sclerotiorum (strain ATCC 18683 / 1980 / Ss-1) TaxID=665079 RepID=A7EWK7_SCLS1|nr:predicted protein [Sclerotinia sclerotiorum 1980 UF-70]EDN93849.1 predicted protein [Sclerotinia sclerotiorum 1980 UF-70]